MNNYIRKRLDSRYEIYELLGSGGMAFVYKAYDIVEKKNVALKILKSEYSENKEFIRRFRNESKAIKILSHQNIVKVFSVNIGSKIQYIVMEYIDGTTLKEYINNNKTNISIKNSIDIIKQILEALKHAHYKGIIHRDIKSQNIMIVNNNFIKITDFGIAKFLKDETKTVAIKSFGSVHYISPEQARGIAADARSDIYSVGIIFYEMITGCLPFESENDFSIALMQMQLDPQRPCKINTSIPPFLENIVLKSMKKNPERRYQTAEEMLHDIKIFEESSDVEFSNKWLGEDIEEENIEQKEKKTSKAKTKKIIFIATGIFVTSLIFTVGFMLFTMFTSYGASGIMKDVDVPDFVGMYLSDIENENYKFHWKIDSVYDPTKPQGVILDQDPLPGSKKIKAGATINLKVNSAGILIDVPQVTGLTGELASLKLMNAGLKSEIRMINDESKPIGTVLYSDPAESTKIMVDSTVILYVSKGPVESVVAVPDVIGKSIAEAKEELNDLKLKVSPDIEYEKNDLPKDTIISTKPLPGIKVNIGSTIDIIASSGVKKDKTIELEILLPQIKEVINLDIYVDGTHNQKVRVDTTAIKLKKFSFTANQGKKEIRVKINDQFLYRVYEINFNAPPNEAIKIIEKHDYPS
ncbi:MAG: Stk1 family PASTA domain-containing Ser/Thr kinase [Candidatus Improbicoccus pseudotrichonymphae]|uniref:non-specific serine/threonine protein kinase n=1 Tax=Candidatus Improbicoccus pseudotrichonymphae TaxID=3033792 RepID=A0AA48KX56_9FIRM|nr:MAG: Stk1 family PASTA domain-containing Ser/Thr kinase [Candidatus Improbicoccus pseudotrichonymphae]